MAEEAASADARVSGRGAKLWIVFLVLIAVAIALAWYGAGSLRPETTQSGLEFRTVKAGKGDPIAPADAALMDYVLTSDDGAVFDSSDSHGGAQPFTAGAVFPGFAEAMGRMQEGGVYRFTMPQRLAFGDSPPPPGFPPNSDLTFDVRVQKVLRGGAAMMQQQMGPQGEAPQPR
ncbi:MAG TPA: FKBP-type peptidyl-prolyl cis-trans isomerase [Sphingomicrobium sp.]|nr:FKBP-type peptidyl-prolyl cis-trans isomerase [Sphingomicrobium sp.]